MKYFTLRKPLLLVQRFNGQWLLLALLMCLAVACKNGRGGHDDVKEVKEKKKPECILDRVTEKELNSFNPNIPLSKGGGHSDAFSMRPLDELIISAPAGAFEQNPDIHVSVASGQQLQAAEERLAEMMPDHELLWGYDIDAGLPSDSVLPGKYTVKINLNTLGIPKELQPYVSLMRMDDEGNLQPINSREKNGIIRYEACQNSVIVTTLSTIAVVVGYQIISSVKVRMKAQAWAEAGYPIGFWNKADLIQLSESDDFGSFNVLFRFTETERGNRFEEFQAKTKELEDRLAQLRKEAEEQYDKEHPSTFCDWLTNAVTMRKQRVGLDAIYIKLVNEDPEVERLKNDPDVEMPQSVLDIIKATKLANRFSRDSEGLGLKPLSYTYNVYLVPQSEMGKGEETTMAKFKPLYLLGGQVLVNYDSYLKKKGNTFTYDQGQWPAMCATMAHEIGHAFENEYIHCVRFSNMRFFEAIGSVTEHWFAAWMKNKGYVTIADTESKEADELFQYANRDNKQLLAWPLELEYTDKANFLNVNNPEMWGGYMLGDLVQFLCDNKKKVSFDEIMTNYAYNKTFLQDLKDIFGIKSNSEFGELYTKFCFKYMPEIFEKQQTIFDKHLLEPTYKHSPKDCVVRLKNFGLNSTNKAYPFAVKTTQFVSNTDRGTTPPYSLFAVPSEKVNGHELMFTFLEGDNLQQTKDSLFIAPCEKKYDRKAQAAIIYREFAGVPTFDNDYYIDIVALYQPKNPVIDGETKDTEGLNIDLAEEPAEALLQAKYITGMQISVVNKAKNKNKTFNVPLSKCGKTVKIPYNEIWISDPEEIDIAVRTRWYYKTPDGKNFYYSPATDRVNYKREKTIEHQEEEEVKPEEEEQEFDKRIEGEVTEDLGEVVIDAEYAIHRMGTANVVDGYWLDYTCNNDGAPIYAHVLVKGKTATITIPTHSVNHAIPENRAHANHEFTGFTIKFKCSIDRQSNAVFVKFESLESVSPSSSTKHEVGDYWQIVYDPNCNPDHIDTHFSKNASSTIQFKSSQKINQETNKVYLKNDRSGGAVDIEVPVHEKYHSVTSNTHRPEKPVVSDGDNDTFLEIKGYLKK